MLKLQIVASNKKKATGLVQSTKYPKIAIVTFEDGTEAMASIQKHFDGDVANFLDAEGYLQPQWSIQNGWLSNNTTGGLSLSDVK